ncbi:glycosyltransferase family 2 protein [Acidothermaceae bacterium B102]|nr:glycosyltransferase family 2 protein [Acidothermaceae bacterium B102]
MIEAIGVVVPARNEEALLPACLASLQTAASHPGLGGVRVRLLVVLDGCTDGSADVASAAGVRILVVDAGNVGIARAAGVSEILRWEPAIDGLWLAMTDADTTVPYHWLSAQLRLVQTGADVVVGTVQVDAWEEHPPAMASRFARHYAAGFDGSGHSHVHGANLGVRASAYVRAGGVAGLALSEDHALVEACSATGARVVRTADLPVTTSARRTGRAAGGFADLLVGLSAEQTIT